MDCLHDEGGIPTEEFLQSYATWEDGNGAKRICRHVFLQESCCRIRKIPPTGKDNILIYAGDLQKNGITTALCSMLEGLDLDKHRYFLSFRMNSVKDRPECMNLIPQKAGVYPLASEINMDIFTGIAHFLWMGRGCKNTWVKKRIDKAYQREWKKHFGSSQFAQVVHYNGYEAYVNLLLKQAPCPRSIWVHSDMEQEIKTKQNQNLHVLEDVYQSYDNVIVVSQDILESTKRLSGRADHVFVIENIHNAKRIKEKAKLPLTFDETTQSTVSEEELKKILKRKETKFISIGRFSPEKGHSRLIRAFDRYYKENPDIWLIIIGGMGTLYEKTIEEAKAVSAASHIILIKSLSNPMPVLKACDLFILSSYYEGMGLVILEADTLGVPAISCDIRGPRGFLKAHGGNLVENSEDGLLEGMKAYASGNIHPMNVDFEELNRKSIEKCEKLFDGSF
jgi:CDP-glycerol glycerophosphotransferase